MKIYNLFLFLCLLFVVTGCDDEDAIVPLDDVAAPSDLSIDFSVATDNSGLVNIRPNGTGVTLYRVFLGDGTEEPVEVEPGGSVDNVYAEGNYTLSLEALGINGLVSRIDVPFTLSLLPPENLMVTITGTAGNPLSIDVTATADLETNFEVLFGENPDQEPVTFQEGEIVQYAYQDAGTYEVTVRALSGSGSTEVVETVIISNPLLLPVDFENATLDYAFVDFNGVATTVIDNPGPDEVNNSDRVAQMNKPAGSGEFSGTFFELGEPIDFSALDKISLKTWSPVAGIPILMKLENATNPDIFTEVSVTNTVASGWEELLFDFSEADLTQDYQKIVLFFDIGSQGTGVDYYFDEFELTDGSGDISLPLNFEAPDLIFEFTGFGTGRIEVIDNPDPSGINTSSKVGEFNKDFGTGAFGGAFIDLTDPIDFSSSQIFNLKVWPAAAGGDVLLKIENPDNPDVFVEVLASTTVTETWETLSFDFSGIDGANNYSRIVLFFNFANPGSGGTYYFDDLELAQ